MGRIAIALLGLVLGLTACATGNVVGDSTRTGDAVEATNQVNTEAALAGADWARALPRHLRVRQNDFRPLVIALRRGNAYILKLENGDDVAHSFRAPEFFQAIAVKSLTPAEGEFAPGTVLSAIDLAPRQTRELAFVPMRDGSFAFSDGWVGMLLGGTFGARGIVTIN